MAFILPSFTGGGSQRVALALLGALDRVAFDPLLVVFQATGPLAESVPRDVPIIALGCKRLRSALLPLLAALRVARPDVVFSTMGHVNLAVLATRRWLRAGPRIVIRESNTPSLSLPAQRFGGLIGYGYRRFYPQAHLVLCQSGTIAAELSRSFGVPTERLRPLANPVDVESIRREAAIPERANGGGAHFVAAGRLTRQKGFDTLIEMLAEISHPVRLTILGEGSDREALERAAARLGVADRVALPGFVARPWSYYAGADAFVLPSRWEGMPNAALEALACGTPVIASTTSGGLAEVAAAAATGAVTLAPVGPEFRDVLASITVRPAGPLRPSLLPPGFELSVVAAEFARCLVQ